MDLFIIIFLLIYIRDTIVSFANPIIRENFIPHPPKAKKPHRRNPPVNLIPMRELLQYLEHDN